MGWDSRIPPVAQLQGVLGTGLVVYGVIGLSSYVKDR